MTLIVDVMFVNSIHFLVSALLNINLITIEHTPKHRSASKLDYLLQHIIKVYARKGFHVWSILMDNEFDKVQDHVSIVNMNTATASEHIAEIVRTVRIIDWASEKDVAKSIQRMRIIRSFRWLQLSTK